MGGGSVGSLQREHHHCKIKTQALTELTLQVEDPQLVHGPLRGYTITYTAQGGAPKTVDVGVVNTWVLTSLEKYTWYTITVSAKNSKYVGPPSKEVKIRTMEDGKRKTEQLLYFIRYRYYERSFWLNILFSKLELIKH